MLPALRRHIPRQFAKARSSETLVRTTLDDACPEREVCHPDHPPNGIECLGPGFRPAACTIERISRMQPRDFFDSITPLTKTFTPSQGSLSWHTSTIRVVNAKISRAAPAGRNARRPATGKPGVARIRRIQTNRKRKTASKKRYLPQPSLRRRASPRKNQGKSQRPRNPESDLNFLRSFERPTAAQVQPASNRNTKSR